MPPPSSIVATIGIKAAVVTADSQAALSVISRTPKARATGDMKLPAMEIERPAKNHRKAGERRGLSGARLTLDAGSASLPGGSESRFSDASTLGTSCHAASTNWMHQLVSGGSHAIAADGQFQEP